MISPRHRNRIGLLALALGLIAGTAHAQVEPGQLIDKVAFDQNLKAQVPLDLMFRDEAGRAVRLGDLMNQKRPIVLSLVYHNCPMLCNQVLNGLVRALRPLSLEPGTDFDLITVSIDPKETTDLSAAKKAGYVKAYDRPGTARAWHFLTGDQASIDALARTVGFRYTYNERNGQYAHAAGVVVLTPTGQVARYLFGIDYPSRDLQFALIEASAGRVGSAVVKLLMLCYDYDSANGQYTVAIMKISQVLGSLTVLLLASAVAFMVLRDRRRAASRSVPVASS
jgi:protein SCO1/2